MARSLRSKIICDIVLSVLLLIFFCSPFFLVLERTSNAFRYNSSILKLISQRWLRQLLGGMYFDLSRLPLLNTDTIHAVIPGILSDSSSEGYLSIGHVSTFILNGAQESSVSTVCVPERG